MRFDNIENFTQSKNNRLLINSSVHPTIGPLITLIHESGSVRFQHDLKPNQARYMANVLMEHADAVEVVDAEIEVNP